MNDTPSNSQDSTDALIESAFQSNELNGTASSSDNVPSILIVEDSSLQAKVIASMISRWQTPAHVQRAKTLEEALKILDVFTPQVILLDLNLPDSQGINTVQAIVSHVCGIAVIVMTASSDEHTGQQAILAGAQDFLSKDELNEKALYRAYRHAVQRQCVLNSNSMLAEQLKVERSLLADVINNVPYYIVWKDRYGRYSGCNQAFAEFAGVDTTDKVAGKSDFQLPWPGNVAQQFAEEDTEVLATGEARVQREISMQRTEGRAATLLSSKVPLRNDQGMITGMLGVYIDITERKYLESQLSQAQKLESIGQLAAGIAHEINTPTQYVSDNVRFMRDQFQSMLKIIDAYRDSMDVKSPKQEWQNRAEKMQQLLDELDYDFLRREIPDALKQSLEGLERVTTIVRAMKDFSHPGSTSRESADLNKAIQSTVEVCRARWKYVSELSLDLKPLPDVPCLVAELNQVILNMIINSADAIADRYGEGNADKGRIRISTSHDSTHAIIVIEDNGKGIPEAIRSRIFDPFFTTKQVGKGTGQGLAISRDVVANKHGGTIDCDSIEGEGTKFTIRLPLIRAGQQEAA